MTNPNPNQSNIDMIMTIARKIMERASHGDTNYETDSETLVKRIAQLAAMGAQLEHFRVMEYLAIVEIMNAHYAEALERLLAARRGYAGLDADTTEREISVLNNIGELFRLIADYPRALERFNEAITLGQAAGVLETNPNMSVLHANLGLTYIALNELDLADAALQAALSLYKSNNHQNLLSAIETQRAIATLRWLRGDLASAWDATKLAMTFVRDDSTFMQTCHVLLTQARIATDDPNYTQAQADDFVSQAQAMVSQIKAPAVRATVWLEEAHLQRIHGDPQIAEAFAHLARTVYEEHNMIEGVAIASTI